MDFGDGNNSTAIAPSHIYTADGVYTASLTVTDNEGANRYSDNHDYSEQCKRTTYRCSWSYPNTGTEALAVVLDGSASSDSDGTIASYAWDFGDGNSGTGVSPSHTYTTAGIYKAILTVTDNDGGTDSDTTTITVTTIGGNVPPTAVASATPISGDEPLTVAFDGSASSDPDGSIASYAWDFGDGGNDTGATPTYIYIFPGVYTATLTVTDNEGASSSTTLSITVISTNVAPTALISAVPTSGDEPLTVAFDGTGSSDSDGTIVSYAWDFGDGNNDTGATPSHIYTSAGSYTASLTVTDNEGATGTTSTVITVTSASGPPATLDAIEAAYTKSHVPDNNFGSKADIMLKNTASRQFDGFVKFDLTGVSTVTTAKIRFYSLNVQALDILISGTSDAWDENTLTHNNRPAKTTGQIASVTIDTSPQYYEVDVTSYVQGELGGDNLVSFYLEGVFGEGATLLIMSDDGANPPQLVINDGSPVPNVAPTAVVTATPTSGDVPLSVAFDGSGSSDTDGTIASYAWDFGDGNNGTGATPSHTYTAAGSYTATLTVTDNEGATGTASVNITATTPGGGVSSTLDAIESTYTKSHVPDNNFGNKVDIQMKTTASRQFEGFVKFDVSSISNVSTAKIRFYSANVEILDVLISGTSDGWDENTMTHNTRPAKTTGQLASVTVDTLPQYYEVDVTSYVQAELGGNNLISFYLEGVTGVDAICSIQSDDGANPPQLVITSSAPSPRIGREAEGLQALQIYPNPFNDHIVLDFGVSLEEEARVMISTLEGKVLVEKSVRGSASYTIDLSANLPEGVYLLRIEHKGERELRRIMKF